MPERSYRGLLWGLALFGTLLDQVSKYGVFKWLYDGQRRHAECDMIPGVLKLLTQFTTERETGDGFLARLRSWSGELLPQVNHGALFGIKLGLGEESDHLANAFFACVSLVAVVAIVYWGTRRSTAQDLSLCAALGLILAGTLGNLYDRVVFGGVRDFLYFDPNLIRWPVFNVADCCLVCGASLLLVQAFWSGRTAPAATRESQAALAPEVAEAN